MLINLRLVAASWLTTAALFLLLICTDWDLRWLDSSTGPFSSFIDSTGAKSILLSPDPSKCPILMFTAFLLSSNVCYYTFLREWTKDSVSIVAQFSRIACSSILGLTRNLVRFLAFWADRRRSLDARGLSDLITKLEIRSKAAFD